MGEGRIDIYYTLFLASCWLGASSRDCCLGALCSLVLILRLGIKEREK